MHDNAISLVDGHRSHLLTAEELHSLRIDHLATRKTGIKMDLRFLATIQDDTLALARHCDISANAAQNIHCLLLVADSNGDGSSVSGLVLDFPLAPIGVKLVLSGTLWLLSGTGHRSLLNYHRLGIFVIELLTPSLLVFGDSLQARRDLSPLAQRSKQAGLITTTRSLGSHLRGFFLCSRRGSSLATELGHINTPGVPRNTSSVVLLHIHHQVL
mmetsp:Transcript_1387/g.2687  ORF Transcript_1387/g.2687 Transcript_1387/m.2687 type:complete len:214 (+) Transcript_1387:309-950(+)